MKRALFSGLSLVGFGWVTPLQAQSLDGYARAEKDTAYYRVISQYLQKCANCPLGSSNPQWSPTVREPRRIRLVFRVYLLANGHIERVELKRSTFEYVDPTGQRVAVQSSSDSFWVPYQECMRQKLLQLSDAKPMYREGKALKTVVVFGSTLTGL